MNLGAKTLLLTKRKRRKTGAKAELRPVSWVVAEKKLRPPVMEGMWECLPQVGNGAEVQSFGKEEGQSRRTVLGITQAIAGLADAMLPREKGWPAWQSGGLTLFLR